MLLARILKTVAFGWLLLSVSSHHSAAQSRSGGVEINSAHSSSIYHAVFSPDASWVATSSGKEIKIWDVATGRLLRTILCHPDNVASIESSHDGRALVASLGTVVKVWDVATGVVLQSYSRSLDSSPIYKDSPHQTIVVGKSKTALTLFDGVVAQWDLVSGQELKAFEVQSYLRTPDRRPRAASAVEMATTPDERTIVIGYTTEARVDADWEPQAAIVVWDALTGKLVKKIAAHSENIKSVAVSEDGKWIASATSTVAKGRDYPWEVKVWELRSGRLVHSFAGEGGDFIPKVRFSPDNRWVFFGQGQDLVRAWDVATGQPAPAIDSGVGKSSYRSGLAFAKTRPFVAFGVGNVLNLFDLNSWRVMQKLPDNVPEFSSVSVAPAPDTRWIVDGPAGLAIWNPVSGEPEGGFQGHDGTRKIPVYWRDRHASSISIDERGHWLLPTSVRSQEGEYLLGWWDLTDAKLVHQRRLSIGPDLWVSDIVGSSDGKSFVVKLRASKGEGEEFRIVSESNQNGTRICETKWGYAAAFSPDGKSIAVKGKDGKKYVIRFCDLSTGRRLRDLAFHDVFSFAYSTDGRSVFISNQNEKLKYQLQRVEAQSGRVIWNSAFPEFDRQYQMAVSPDGKWLVTSRLSNATLWDASTGARVKALEGNFGAVKSLAFSSDSHRIFVGYADSTGATWSEKGELLTTMAQSASGEWLTMTPEGFFAASEKGAGLLHVVQGMRVNSIDQFYNQLYRPDLVREKLAGDPQGKVRDAAAKLDLTKAAASGSAPRVTITSAEARVLGDQATVEAEIVDQGGGIGKVEWRVNGVTLGVEERGIKRISDAPTSVGKTIKISRMLGLTAGENRIAVLAYNDAGLIASEPAEIVATSVQATEGVKPRLYVLAVGVNDYWDSALHLNYAAIDARSLSDGFRQGGASLYERVEIRTVLDAEATATKLDGVFREMASKVRPQDVFVFFLAGHGKTVDARFYFLPQDFRYAGEDSIIRQGIGQDQLQAWFSRIRAQKSVLLFDACESGSLIGDRIAMRGIEEKTAIDRMTRAMGRTVLTATTDNKPAIEGYRGHGVFTYTLLLGLEAADSNSDGVIEVTELAQYVDRRLPELTYDTFKLRQVPQMSIVGSNFPLVSKIAVLNEGQPPTAAELPTTPTHFVILPATVRESANSTSPAASELSIGMQVVLIQTANGWALVARDGKKLGWVEETKLVRPQ